MNRKKLTALIMVLALALTTLVGGTLAYFTDTDAATNVFVMGNVEIDLIEDYDQHSNLQPGLNINKDVWVKNTGSNDAYVRIHLAIPAELDDGNPEFNASRNFLHWNFTNESVADGQWSWIPEYTTGVGYKGNGAGNWNFYETDITLVEDNPNTPDVDESVVKLYNVYVATYRTALGSGKTTETTALDKVYVDKSVNAIATKAKDENGADVVVSYTYFDNKGNEFTYTVEEANKIQILVVAEGTQTATFANAYDALNTAFGAPTTASNPWNNYGKS